METIIDVYLSDGFIRNIITRGDIAPIVENAQQIAKSLIDPTSMVTLADFPTKVPNRLHFKLKITHLAEMTYEAAGELFKVIEEGITSNTIMEPNYPKTPHKPFHKRIAIENGPIVYAP